MPERERFVMPDELESTLRKAAIVSAVVERWRDFRFQTETKDGRRFGVWRDTAGNYAYALFIDQRAVLFGFDHESPMSPHAVATGPEDFLPWPGIYDELPSDLLEAVQSTAFTDDFDCREVTFCLWNETSGNDWNKGVIAYPKRDWGDPDGSGYILGRLTMLCLHFEEEVRDYYSTVFGSEDEEEELDEDDLMPPEAQQLLFDKLRSGIPFTADDLAQLVQPDCNSTEVAKIFGSLGAFSE